MRYNLTDFKEGTTEKQKEVWFMNILKKIMKHNKYTSEMITVTECDKKDRWTPVDLILREYYNNGCGSSMGFLGIQSHTCEKCYRYIRNHLEELISKDMINKTGVNNFGFVLWTNYNR